MKKKLILLPIILILPIIILCSCNNSNPSGSLTSNWLDYEKFVYDFEDAKGTNLGKLTYEIERINDNKESIKIGTKEVKNFTGSKINYSLKLDDGDSVVAVALFDNLYRPKYSYKESNIKGKKTSIQAEWVSKRLKNHYNYILKVNDKETKGKIKVSTSSSYDNEMVPLVLRGADIKANWSINVPFALDNIAQKRIITKDKDVTLNTKVIAKEKIDEENKEFVAKEFKCNVYTVQLDQKLSGAPFKMYYATEQIQVETTKKIIEDNSVELKDNEIYKDELLLDNVLVKFVENGYVYTLKEISITK